MSSVKEIESAVARLSREELARFAARAIAEEVAFLAALEQGDQDIQAGRVVSNEDARKKLES